MPTSEQRHIYSQKYKLKRRELLHAIKDVPCKKCGKKYPPWVMEFHHRDPDEKTFDIGTFATMGGLERLLEEIEKCDIYCSNCHQDLEYRVRNDLMEDW